MSPPRTDDTPPPRKKSCLACIKAKRRCDQRLPACLRCTQRRTTCVYPHPQAARTLRNPRGQPEQEPRPGEDVSLAQSSHEDDITDTLTLGYDFGFSADGSTFGPQLCWPVSHSHRLSQHDEDFRVHMVERPLSSPTLPEWSLMVPLDYGSSFGDVSRQSLFPVPSQTPSTAMTSTQLAPTSSDTALTGYFNMEIISAELDCKLAYAVDKIKSAPKAMLAELQTPWCHPSLYKDGMPPVMQGQC